MTVPPSAIVPIFPSGILQSDCVGGMRHVTVPPMQAYQPFSTLVRRDCARRMRHATSPINASVPVPPPPHPPSEIPRGDCVGRLCHVSALITAIVQFVFLNTCAGRLCWEDAPRDSSFQCSRTFSHWKFCGAIVLGGCAARQQPYLQSYLFS